MYSLADVVPDRSVPPGTNLLVSGPPMTDKRRLALRVLAEGTESGDGALVVTTQDGADRILTEYRELAAVDDVPFGIVDCVSRQQGSGGLPEDPRVTYASSPVDMTGIGIQLSEFLESFYGRDGVERNRVTIHSLSTMLMYADLETVFRFLHVFAGRIQQADALGMVVIDSTAHDEQTVNTIKQLFDGVLRVESGADGDRTVSLGGLD